MSMTIAVIMTMVNAKVSVFRINSDDNESDNKIIRMIAMFMQH